MTDSRSLTTAYLLFVIAGFAPLAIGIANLVPMSTTGAGGVGLLILVPASLAGFAATVAAVIRTIRLRGPAPLVILSLISLLYVAGFFAMDSLHLPKWIATAFLLSIGAAIVILALRGLLLGRRRGPPAAPI